MSFKKAVKTVARTERSNSISSRGKLPSITLPDAKQRIKELETEVSELKNRLDQLRRAKLQTIVKKENNYIGGKEGEVSPALSLTSDKDEAPQKIEPAVVLPLPPIAPPPTSPPKNRDFPGERLKYEAMLKKVRDANDKLVEERDALHVRYQGQFEECKKAMLKDLNMLKQTHFDEMKSMSERYAEVAKAQKGAVGKYKNQIVSTCEDEVTRLKELLEKLKSEHRRVSEEHAIKSAQCTDLESQVEELVMQLSIKEANWCELEEKLKQEIQASWGERYQQWMVATEKKIEELRATNEYLKNTLDEQSQNRRAQ